MMNNLKGITVLNTRPKHQASELTLAIENGGGVSIDFPTLEIHASSQLQSLSKKLQKLPSDAIGIFMSANAVTYAHQFIPQNLNDIIAIGPGTQAQLEKLGHSVTLQPENFSSEGILDLTALKNITGKTIVIFCGENAKPLLREILQQRGALVIEAICYCRKIPHVSSQELEQLTTHVIDIIISTSSESLENLYQILSPHYSSWLQTRPIIIVSDKMRDLLKHRSHSGQIIQADNASQAAIMNALIAWKLNTF